VSLTILSKYLTDVTSSVGEILTRRIVGFTQTSTPMLDIKKHGVMGLFCRKQGVINVPLRKTKAYVNIFDRCTLGKEK